MERVGDYHLLRELAEAGTGRLHLARHHADDDAEPLVLKLIHERFRRNSFYTATLFSEAPAARRFRHPTSLAIYDVDDAEGRLYIAMEQATGPSWKEIRERARATGRTFSTDAILWVARRVAGLLGAAREHPWAEGESEGLLVGQLAPHGVYLTKVGEVRLSGMGLGRSRSCLPPTRSRLPYRAPELFAREPLQPATDVYGLGIVLHDALSGTEAFQRDSVAAVKSAVLEETIPPLDHVEPAVRDLVQAMVAKDPDDRPDDLTVVGAVLDSAIGRDGSLLSAEWAEHVRILFPELFETTPLGEPPRPPRVSVPYSQTSNRKMPPRGLARPAEDQPPTSEVPIDASPPSPSTGPFRPLTGPSSQPRVSTSDLGPSTYDIEDLAEILASARDAPGVDRGVVEPDPPVEPQRAAEALAALEDRTERFDVDSVVDAIFAGSESGGGPPGATGDPSVDLLPPLELDSGDLPEDPIPEARPLPRSETLPPVRPRPGSRPLTPTPWNGARAEPGPSAVGPAEPPTVPPADELDEPHLAPGSVIQDRYRIIRELGRGGMSIVYRAEHMLLLNEVALKLLRPELSTLGNVVERFQREARSVCRLDDPNIVRVTDFGRTADGLLYLVMELIRGDSLASLLQQRGRVPLREAISLVDQILAGLEQAHRYDIVHRDLKPENIMLVPKDGAQQVKILDFGIAKLGGGDEEGAKSITQAGTVFGTPRYMSPEQAAGEPVDHRTDLYTVGVILYQLLTGRVPFQGETTVQLLAKVLTQDPPPMDFEAPREGARRQVESVTLKALAKEPEDRFPTARAFREALDGCLLF